MTRVLTSDMKQYNYDYYHTKLKTAYREKVFCDICNRYVNLSSFKRHLTSNYHKNNMNCTDCNCELIHRILSKLV